MRLLLPLALSIWATACATSQPLPAPTPPCPSCPAPRPAVIPPAECTVSREAPPVFVLRELPPASDQARHALEAARQAIDYADGVRVYAVDLHDAWERCADWARQVHDER